MLRRNRLKLLLAAVAVAGVTSVAQAAVIYIAENASGPMTLSYEGAEVSFWNVSQNDAFASGGSFRIPTSLAQGANEDVNILWTDPGTGTQSDYLHTQWTVSSGVAYVQWQMTELPTIAPGDWDFSRPETLGFMYLTPSDVASNGHALPTGLSFGVQSEVPEPSTYLAGVACCLGLFGIIRRRRV